MYVGVRARIETKGIKKKPVAVELTAILTHTSYIFFVYIRTRISLHV